mgnify:CR=1 FL=1
MGCGTSCLVAFALQALWLRFAASLGFRHLCIANRFTQKHVFT